MPTVSTEEQCLTFPVLVMGVVLRVWLGAAIPDRIRRFCCCSSPDRPIFVTDCEDESRRHLVTLAFDAMNCIGTLFQWPKA